MAAQSKAATSIGEGIASLGKAGEAFYQKQLQQEEYDAERKFQEFKFQRQQDLIERQRNAPTGAAGFTEGFQQDYYKGASELLASLPETQKAKYDAKLRETDIDLTRTAQQFQFGEQSRAAGVELDETLNTVHGPRARTTPTEDIDKVAADYERVVQLNPNLTQKEKDERIRKSREAIALSHLDALPPEQRLAVLNAPGGGFDAKLKYRESRNRPDVVNQLGYAGLYQFGAPRLSDIGVYTPGANENVSAKGVPGGWSGQKWSGEFNIPGFPEVKTLEDFKRNPAAQEAAYQLHKQKMDREIAENGLDRFIGQNVHGVPITRDGLYGMLHIGGVGGARNALEKGIVARDANQTSVLDYARTFGDGGGVLANLSPDTRARLLHSADVQLNNERAKAAVVESEALEIRIRDAAAGRGTMPDLAEIQNNTVITPAQRSALIGRHDQATKELRKYGAAYEKFKAGGSFNPYDKDERTAIDKIYQQLGSDDAALQAVVDRSNILPKSAAVSMRGDLVSNDAKRVAGALTKASNLLAKNQNIFTGVDGQKDFENYAVTFRHYVDDLGMSADAAAKKIIESQSAEYQAAKNARIKSEDIDAKIKKELSINDLRGAFDQVPWVPFTDPQVGITPETRLAMYGQYAEQVKERYLEHGDFGRAKKEAASILGKSWGVTRVNGTATVVPYAPDRAPTMAGVENPADAIASGASKAIKDAFGYEPARKSLQFFPVPGVTAQAYKSGQPVPYILKWEDANGNVQVAQKHFVIDGKDARTEQTTQRQAQFTKGAAAASVNAEMRDVTPEPLRQYGFQ